MNKAEIKLIQQQVAGSLAIENAFASKKAISINKQFLEGKISSADAIKKIKKHYL